MGKGERRNCNFRKTIANMYIGQLAGISREHNKEFVIDIH